MRYYGFEPTFWPDSEILILGSFPSVKSREVSFYYGNPQNRFWRVLAKSFGENVPKTLDEKLVLLRSHKIALWDMVTSCEIQGSLDSSIKNFEVANLQKVIDGAPIKKIILNGGKAKEIFIKNYKNLLDFAVFLPSTSPLNTKFDENIWLDNLR